MFRHPMVARIVGFLSDIGISVADGELAEDTFLPGVSVNRGVLIVDQTRLRYPGDLLHEAGHLALLTPEERKLAGADLGNDGGIEMAAIAWSYAAALHISIDADIVFHAGGYRSGSQSIVENFSRGQYIGVPVLEWLDMAAGDATARKAGVPAYPKMLRWLRP
jgi:hypothetical protein